MKIVRMYVNFVAISSKVSDRDYAVFVFEIIIPKEKTILFSIHLNPVQWLHVTLLHHCFYPTIKVEINQFAMYMLDTDVQLTLLISLYRVR